MTIDWSKMQHCENHDTWTLSGCGQCKAFDEITRLTRELEEARKERDVNKTLKELAEILAKNRNEALMALRAAFAESQEQVEYWKKLGFSHSFDSMNLRTQLIVLRSALDQAHPLVCDETNIERKCFICEAIAKVGSD